MARGVRWYLVGSLVLVGLAGCGRGWLAFEEREAWRHEAEVACLNSGTVKEGPGVAQIAAIQGPGACGADYPLKVAVLGESSLLGFADELRPPAAIPQYSPIQSRSRYAVPPYQPPDDPPPYAAPAYPQRPYGPPRYEGARPAIAPAPGAPLSISPPGINSEEETEEPAPPPRYGQQKPYVTQSSPLPEPSYNPRPYSTQGPYVPPASQPAEPYVTPAPRTYGAPAQPSEREPLPPLGPSRDRTITGAATAVAPAATLACPMVSALDQWIAGSVQPAAQRWFGQQVVEIKQISAYSCRGMNGRRGSRISEHAFGNALDVAAFTLADGRKVTVRDGWRGLPEERGFLHDVHAAACQQFSTVLGPGSNVYHYDHLHLDLMRRSSGNNICNPAAIPGDLVARRRGEPVVTGSLGGRRTPRTPALGYAPGRAGDPSLPVAVAGED